MEDARNALNLSRSQFEQAFGGVVVRARQRDERAGKMEMRKIMRERRKGHVRKLRALEDGWLSSNACVARMEARGVFPAKKRKGRKIIEKIHDMNSLPHGRLSDKILHERSSASFEFMLEKEAIIMCMRREELMVRVRCALRNADELNSALLRMLEALNDATVKSVLAIANWQSCFVDTEPFYFAYDKEKETDFLANIKSSTDFIRRRFFNHEVAWKPGFALVQDKLTDTEREVAEILENNAGLQVRRCSWCGATPAKLIPCGDAFCKRSLYCKECIQARCGGVHALNQIASKISFSCFLCTAKRAKDRNGKKKKDTKTKQQQRLTS